MPIKESSVKKGSLAEEAASEFLIKQGMVFIENNYRGERGEIDLIMGDESHLVFVEVRLREDIDFGSSLETITQSKKQRIIQTAKEYLQQKKLYEKRYSRFDVVGIHIDPETQEKNFQWIKNAFGVNY